MSEQEFTHKKGITHTYGGADGALMKTMMRRNMVRVPSTKVFHEPGIGLSPL